MAGGNKSVRLYILGNNKDAKAKIDIINAKADELEARHPELHFGIETARAQEEMALLRAELRETAAAADESGLQVRAFGKEATITSEHMAKAWEITKYALLGVGGAIGFGIYKAAGFQKNMELISTQAGVNQKSLKGLGDGVLKLAGQVGEDPNSLAESLYHVESAFASMHQKGFNALNLVKIAAEGAKTGNADLVDVTNALGAAIASGIPGVQNYSQAMGALNAIVGSGDMHMQDLADAMGTGMVAVVKGFGLSLNDVGAALATFGDNNIRGMDAATALRMSVMALAKPSKEGEKLLQSWGVTAGNLSDDMKKHGLLSALEHLQALFKANGITAKDQGQVITDIFGKKAGTGLNVLMDQMDRLKSKYPAIEAGAHNFGKAWDATQQTVGQQFDQLKAGSTALAIGLGEKLLPAALKVEKWLVGFVNGLENGSTKAQALVGVIGTALAAVALAKLTEGIKGAVEGLETFGKAAWGAAKAVYGAGQAVVKFGVSAAKWSWQAAQAAGEWTAAAAKTVGAWVKAGAQMAWQGIVWAASQAKSLAIVVAENVAGAATTAAAWVVANGAMLLGIGAVVALIGIAVFEIVKHWHTIWTWTTRIWGDVWNFVKHGVEDGINFVRSHWPLLLGILTGPIGLAAMEIATHWHQIIAGAERLYHDVVDFFHNMRSDILHVVSDFGHLLWNAGSDLISGLLSGIDNMAGRLWDKVKSIGSGISSVFKGVLSILSPSRVFMEHGKNIVLGLVGGIDGYAHLAENSVRNLAQRSINASSGRFYGAQAHGNSANLTIEWVGGAGADQEFITWLKKNIRIRGGNPSVLGR